MCPDQSTTIRAALDTQYEIIRELGRGGTALVYLARERASGADVAIKLIRAKYLDDEETLARFAREARFVARLHHPNIVPMHAVLDLGDLGLAIVMSHVADRTLKEVIRVEGRLLAPQAEQVMRDIAGALGAAHAMGIVHRDVKPENIFIGAEGGGRALLADFGLARSMKGDTELTMHGFAIGTPAYMSPEQIEGEELDARADVYSLGLVAWEMLTGHRPWDGQSLYSVLYKQKHEQLPDVRELRDDVPDALANVIVRATAKDREARWRNMHELLHALDGPAPARPPQPLTRVANETVRFVRPSVPPPAPAAVAVVAAPERFDYVDEDAVLTVPAAVTPGRRASALRAQVALHKKLIVRMSGGTAAMLVLAVLVRIRPAPAPRLLAASPEVVQAGDIFKPVPLVAPAVTPRIAAPDSVRPTPVPRVAVRDTMARDTIPRDSVRPLTLIKVPVLSAFDINRGLSHALAETETHNFAVITSESAMQRSRESSTTRTPSGPSTISSVVPSLVGSTAASADTRGKLTIGAGGAHSCLVATDGRAFCWGSNDRGQLGGGLRSATPRLIGGTSDLRLSSVAVGMSHTCGLARGGMAWCWGDNDHGQLGDRSFTNRSAPVRAAEDYAFVAITTGAAHTCALDVEGGAWCWGANARGQLGDATTRDAARPVAVGHSARFLSMVAGWNFNCGILVNGPATCWGANDYGQLGDGTTLDGPPARLASGVPFTSITAGGAHACGVTAGGEAYCWGRNSNGQIGDGTKVDRSTPVLVRSTVRFVSIAAGELHTCAIAVNGDAYCWGRNNAGQLGNGTTDDATQPTIVAGGAAFASVRAFGSHTCGVTRAGDAYCWGDNQQGQLGDGTRVNRTHPVRVGFVGSNGG